MVLAWLRRCINEVVWLSGVQTDSSKPIIGAALAVACCYLLAHTNLRDPFKLLHVFYVTTDSLLCGETIV
jgi:hypothetical protein